MNEDFDIRQERSQGDRDFEKALRPVRFDDFAGQEGIINNLRVSSRSRQDHVVEHYRQ